MNCNIKICDNVSINGKPIYLLSCNPTNIYSAHKKRANLLITKDQREILNQLNPYGQNYNKELHNQLLENIEIKERKQSPITITDIPISPKGGKQIFKKKHVNHVESRNHVEPRNHVKTRNRTEIKYLYSRRLVLTYKYL